jgi:hypothetical protein
VEYEQVTDCVELHEVRAVAERFDMQNESS